LSKCLGLACGRSPAYAVRVNTNRVSIKDFCEDLKEHGVEAAPSKHLPHEFVSVNSGMQQLLRAGFFMDGICQVCFPIAVNQGWIAMCRFQLSVKSQGLLHPPSSNLPKSWTDTSPRWLEMDKGRQGTYMHHCRWAPSSWAALSLAFQLKPECSSCLSVSLNTDGSQLS
jgi:hypothetical protein